MKRYWTTIRAQMEGLPAATKLLIGSLVVILLLVGFIAVLYAGKSEVVPISQFAGSRSEEVVARLDANGIRAELKNGQIYVPVNQRIDAIALLAREDMLSDQASVAFADLAGNPWETDAQGRRKYLLAMQSYLNQVARKFNGVKSAEVLISLPERVGFGRTTVRPSASVTVTMQHSNGIDNQLVAALAGLVSGAVAEMEPADVVVIDANRGQQHTVADPRDVVPTEVIELVRSQEKYHREKIEDTLRNIPGVIVAVKVSTSAIRREVREERKYEESEPLRSEEDTESVSRDFAQAAEAGARPNTTLTIDTGGGITRETTDVTSRREFGDKLLASTSQIEMAGHQVEQINVTINVPRSYFVSIFKANHADAKDAPDDAALEPIRTAQLEAIKKQVTPLVMAKAPGVIEANMVYDQAFFQPAVAAAGEGGASGVLGTVTSSGSVATATAVGLAVVSLLLALSMVKRATRPQELPSIEELAGLPPTLPLDEDLVGEAGGVESSLTGVELDEDEMRARHLAKQISDLVKSSPADAGNLLGRWVQSAD